MVHVEEAGPHRRIARSGPATATAQVVDGTWQLHLDHRDADPATAAQLLAALVAAADDGRPARWWVEAADDDAEAVARAAGLVRDRELLQLRRPLPLDEHATIPVRPFDPDRDVDGFLAVNNAAFAWHEDQRDWDRARLEEGMAAPWFDPAGFLVHEDAGRLVGFCWTKEHRATVPPLGEIYVIAVHPDHHGRGLGRQLTLAGLDHLANRGLPVAMLYVEAGNRPARRLYEDLGFTVHHHDRRYGTGPARAGGAQVETSSTDPMA